MANWLIWRIDYGKLAYGEKAYAGLWVNYNHENIIKISKLNSETKIIFGLLKKTAKELLLNHHSILSST